MPPYIPISKKQEHITPDIIYTIIEEETGLTKLDLYDPCIVGTPFKSPCFFNSLYSSWMNFNYVNPNYDKESLEKFIQKAVKESLKGKISIMLLPTKTDQDWFHDIILNNDYRIIWIRGRLKFKNNKFHAPNTHFLVIIKEKFNSVRDSL